MEIVHQVRLALKIGNRKSVTKRLITECHQFYRTQTDQLAGCFWRFHDNDEIAMSEVLWVMSRDQTNVGKHVDEEKEELPGHLVAVAGDKIEVHSAEDDVENNEDDHYTYRINKKNDRSPSSDIISANGTRDDLLSWAVYVVDGKLSHNDGYNDDVSDISSQSSSSSRSDDDDLIVYKKRVVTIEFPMETESSSSDGEQSSAAYLDISPRPSPARLPPTQKPSTAPISTTVTTGGLLRTLYGWMGRRKEEIDAAGCVV